MKLADPADVGRLEVVKWAAFVAMIVDHVDLALFGRALGGQVVGAFAFPAFALCFGLGLARTGEPGGVVARLVVPAVLAQVAWVFIEPGHRANVLIVFAAAAVCVMWHRVSPWMSAAGFAVCAAIAVGQVEGGPLGVLIVAAGFAAGRLGVWWPVVLVGALWCVGAPSVGAVLGFLVPMLWPASIPRLPRLRGALMWAYPGHLVILATVVVAAFR